MYAAPAVTAIGSDYAAAGSSATGGAQGPTYDVATTDRAGGGGGRGESAYDVATMPGGAGVGPTYAVATRNRSGSSGEGAAGENRQYEMAEGYFDPHEYEYDAGREDPSVC